MVKDDVPDCVVKKRRKTVSTNPITEVKPAPDTDIYTRVLKYEESEAQQRSPDKDAALFKKICNDIRQILSDIAKLKLENTDQAKSEITERRIHASTLFLVLKKLNRLEKYRTKDGRDTLQKKKQTVDSTHLQLQNLLYESEHLNKEVTKCLQFKSKDEEIDLVDEEEFFEKAPKNIKKQDVTKDDTHRLQLARLEYELVQRKELSSLCKELQTTKEHIAADIVAKRHQLDQLTPQLHSMLQATQPLQVSMGLPIDKERQAQAKAKLLSDPLYLLYVNIYSYMQACDKLLSVYIEGDEDEAKQVKTNQGKCEDVDESESDTETDNVDESTSRQKRHHRKMSKVDRLESKRAALLKPHPLTVVVNISLKDKSSMKCHFAYIMQLNIVTVKSSVETDEPITGVSAGELISPAHILTCLFPGDTGDNSPNHANGFQLSQLGMGDISPLLADLGFPYVWAQQLCGLEFLRADNKAQGATVRATTVSIVERTMKALRERLIARVTLCKQMQKLESGNIPCVPDPSLFPVRLSGSLVQWTSLPWSEYSTARSTQGVIESSSVSPSDIFYRAIITRGSAKLVCLVAVGCDYPASIPILSLTLHWNGELNATNSDAIRDMERAVNCNWKEIISRRGWSTFILAMQLTRVLACFDVFLESEGTVEFPTDKTFFKAVRGRNRSRPYKYLPKAGGIFTHY